MAYDREQLRLTRAIQHEARRRYKDPKLRKRRVLAGLSIGLVETGMHNLTGGDADSVNFRQERKSIYGGDMNVERIAARMFDEMDAHDHGQSKGELAADVQRPREDLRGKYALSMGEAKRLRRAAGGTGSGTKERFSDGKAPRFIPGGTKVDEKGALVDALLHHSEGGSILKRYEARVDSGAFTTTTKSRVEHGKAPTMTGTTRTRRDGATPSGTATFDGKLVLAKFLPELKWARAHGWKGTVTSGVRTKKEQLAAAKHFGLQHYGPAGPLGSNHVEGHRGALDVTDPDGLERVLRKYPGRLRLRRGMADDPVHFSPTGH